MKAINLIYSIIRKSFNHTQDGGNTYLSVLLLLTWFSFGTVYNSILFFMKDFGLILGTSFILSILTAIVLFFYPGYKYREERIANLTGFRLHIVAIGISFFFLGFYLLSTYVLYYLYF